MHCSLYHSTGCILRPVQLLLVKIRSSLRRQVYHKPGCMMKRNKEGAGGDGEFWKKLKYGAMTVASVSSGIYAATTILKQRGVILDVVEGVRAAMRPIQHALPNDEETKGDVAPAQTNGTAGVQKHTGRYPPTTMQTDEIADRQEVRAVLNVQLQYAMQHNDVVRVQDISRRLDELDEVSVPHKTLGGFTSVVDANKDP